MRDMAILTLIVLALLWTLKSPWVAAMAWTLISLGSPHAEFGYAAAKWPVALGFAVTALIGLLTSKQRQNPLVGSAPKWLLAFTVWITVTLPFSFFVESSVPLWERSIKIFLMVFVTMALINDRRKLNVFIWVCVVSVAYFGIKGGVFTLVTGGSYRVWGPGGFIEGNNEVALAVLLVVPLMRYLQQQLASRWAVHAMTVGMSLCVVTLLGTHSRGALVGLVCVGLAFWIKDGRKLLGSLSFLLLAVISLSVMPEHWWERMGTIAAYEQDRSAQGRINAWGLAVNVANDRIFGGGFSMWTSTVFKIYGPDPDAHHAAHSIYFQVLGEHGWIGLGLFLAVGIATWWTARDLISLGRQGHGLLWAGQLGAMIQVSMVAYASAGAFLSLAYYDLPYNVMVIAVVARRFARTQLEHPTEVAKPGSTTSAAGRARGPDSPALQRAP